MSESHPPHNSTEEATANLSVSPISSIRPSDLLHHLQSYQAPAEHVSTSQEPPSNQVSTVGNTVTALISQFGQLSTQPLYSHGYEDPAHPGPLHSPSEENPSPQPGPTSPRTQCITYRMPDHSLSEQTSHDSDPITMPDLQPAMTQPLSHFNHTTTAPTHHNQTSDPITTTTPISHQTSEQHTAPIHYEHHSPDTITRTRSMSEADKVSVVLRPVGNAPMLQKQRYNVDQSKTVQWMAKWIKNKLKSQTSDSIIIFTAQHFAPPLDQQVGNLYDCFGANDKLVVHYATQPAWG